MMVMCTLSQLKRTLSEDGIYLNFATASDTSNNNENGDQNATCCTANFQTNLA